MSIIGGGAAVYTMGSKMYDATNNMANRPMGNNILDNPDMAAAAQQGQINGLNDMGNVGGAGAELVHRNPISSAIDKIQWVVDKINSIISDTSAPKDGSTVTGSGGYTVGGLPGRLVVPAAPYAGSQH
jgi:hypothetical protein